jgi:hypothetical protein
MPNNPLKLCIISGSFEYDLDASLTIFRDYIKQHYPVQSTLIIYQNGDDDQSLEPLAFTRRLNTTWKLQ